MNRSLLLIAGTIGAALVTAACGGNPYGGGSGATNTSGGYTATSAATVAVGSSKVGKILVDGSGRTLYLFAADSGTTSNCYDSCAQVWPVLATSGKPVAGPGVNASLLSTTQRKDGSVEVVYNGHPLYYFSGDKQPGDITGQDLNSFGAPWYVLSPDGAKVDAG
jgi:predicted lipoprotein with Yx(FWY)xxD motif